MSIHRLTRPLVVLALVSLGACVAINEDSDRRIVGRIDQVQRVPQGNEPPQGLQLFGLFGNWMNDSAERSKPMSLYVVKTAAAELVKVEINEEFAIGDCVEVIPRKNATASDTFSFGHARMIASNRCSGSTSAAPPPPR